MKHKLLIVVFLTIVNFTLMGCSTKNDVSGFNKISSKEAKEMMDDNKDLIILDVRSAEEFSTGYIEGALLIPDNEIVDKAENVLTDKTATILVYCRSGRRSALAAEELTKLGYTNIYDFGGINDWSYDIVTDNE